MDENGDEEDAIKVRDRSSGTNDSAPEEAHGPIGDVVLVISNVNRAVLVCHQLGHTGLREYFHHPHVKRRFLRAWPQDHDHDWKKEDSYP